MLKNLNVKLLIDDNNLTIAGHPTDYMPGLAMEKTLRGHGMTVSLLTVRILRNST